jgi:hypothetical protein
MKLHLVFKKSLVMFNNIVYFFLENTNIIDQDLLNKDFIKKQHLWQKRLKKAQRKNFARK